MGIRRLFVLSLLMALSAPALSYAEAEEVLVPTELENQTSPSTLLPEEHVPTPTSAHASRKPDLKQSPNQSFPAPASSPMAGTIYISPTMQDALIKTEQERLAASQGAMVRFQRMEKAHIARPDNGSVEYQGRLQKKKAKFSYRIQKSQERLQKLQAGPITLSDLQTMMAADQDDVKQAALYQKGYR